MPTSLTFHSEPQFKSTLALVVLTFWLAEVMAPPRTHNTWPAACSALRWALWSSWRRYTQYEIIAETRLDPKGVYVFGTHPHGVFPLAQWLTINVSDKLTRQASPIDAAIAAAFPMPCRVYGQVVTFESRRGAKVFERYGFQVLNRSEITKYRKTHPEPVYLTTVLKELH